MSREPIDCETMKDTSHRNMGQEGRCVLITGITGQDGSYLAELFEKGIQCME